MCVRLKDSVSLTVASDKLAKRNSLLSTEAYFAIIVRNSGVCTHADTLGRKICCLPITVQMLCLCICPCNQLA